jgi:signal transduction histidine kinase
LRRRDVIGRPIQQILPPVYAEQFIDQNQRVIEAAGPLEFEFAMDTPSGQRIFHVFKFPLREGTGRVEGVGGISLDLTEGKRAEEALRQYAERLQALSRRVVEVQEEERRHLARELHDEVGQILSAISINLQTVKSASDAAFWPRLEENISLVDRAIHQVRSLAFELRPAMLDDLGLAATVRWYADRQAQRAGLVVHSTDESSGRRLATDLETACYRVVQEALTNVVRHARARQVWIDLREENQELSLVVRDDGAGFDPPAVRQRAAQGAGFGLLAMQERVHLLGGQIDIESVPGQGTAIRVRFPTPPRGAQKSQG